MKKYNISEEFFPYSKFTPPIKSPEMAGRIGAMMRPPSRLWSDPELAVRSEKLASFDGEEIELLIMEPRHVSTDCCLVYYHGGGFFFGGALSHYNNAKAYALRTPCRVVFVQYRLAPAHPFPIPVEDCYAALCHVHAAADLLGISRARLAVGGDSAGGCLAAAVAQMVRDRACGISLRFQLLIYPFTDRRMDSESNRRFTDTPMWNSTLSKIMVAGYIRDSAAGNIAYASPMEGSCEGLPPAYIETAEFDCLRDDGLRYGEKLREAGVEVVLNETRGTMHGFDIAGRAPTTIAAVTARIDYMRGEFAR